MLNNKRFSELYKNEEEACDAVLNNIKRYIQSKVKLQSGLTEEEREFETKKEITFLKKAVKGLLNLNSIAKNSGLPIVDRMVNVMDESDCRRLIQEFVQQIC